MSLLIKNAHLISPGFEAKNAALLIENGKITKVFNDKETLPAADEVFDAEGNMLMPGFIDVHCHGCVGYEATSEEADAIRIISEGKISEGVTAYCPTTLTLPEERLTETFENIEAYRKAPTGSKVLGIHLEGPYINPECAGAQNPAYLRSPDFAEVMRLHKISPMAYVSYAVELPGSLEFTKALTEAGIVCSCAHTNATYAEFKEAMPFGMKRLTHFCNQMTKLHHREIGMVGTGLYEDDVNIEMICDKIHLCPDMINLAFKCKNIENIQLITDAMEATGLPDGDYQLGGLAVVVSDGAARLASNGALAGSTLRMNEALKNVAELTKLPLTELVKTTSYNQANELGIKDMGKIEEGFCADITILNENFEVKAVFIDGKKMG